MSYSLYRVATPPAPTTRTVVLLTLTSSIPIPTAVGNFGCCPEKPEGSFIHDGGAGHAGRNQLYSSKQPSLRPLLSRGVRPEQSGRQTMTKSTQLIYVINRHALYAGTHSLRSIHQDMQHACHDPILGF